VIDGPRSERPPRDPAHPLQGARIVVGVAGGIAAYKAAELVRLFDKAGAHCDVAMTARAQKFVGAMTFQALTRRPVFTDLFSLTEEATIGHIQLADQADLIVIAPATANVLARLAAGQADDVVAAIALATRAPVLLAPSMNVNMWNHPLTQANVMRLVEVARYRVVGPGDGFLACRWTGPGRLAEPADIVEAAAHVLSRQDLAGKRIVVTAGPTHEAIDPARFLGNRSSGKMGAALAAAAQRRGADVTLLLGPSAIAPPVGVTVRRDRIRGAAPDRAHRRCQACRRHHHGRRGRRLPARCARRTQAQAQPARREDRARPGRQPRSARRARQAPRRQARAAARRVRRSRICLQTVYPCRSSAARKKAVTEGSSSINRIGRGRLIAALLILQPPWRPLLILSPPVISPRTCCRLPLHCSSIESRRYARAQFRSKCSSPVRCLCPSVWW